MIASTPDKPMPQQQLPTDDGFPRKALLALKVSVLTVVVLDLLLSLRFAFYNSLDVETCLKAILVCFGAALIKRHHFWICIVGYALVFVHELLSL